MRYSIRAAADKKTVELDVYEDIGRGGFFYDAVSAKAVRRFLAANQGAERINLNVNSRGGEVIEGFAIYNALAKHPAKVVANVDALAASMASIVILAADEVNIASNGRLMIHNPSAGLSGEAKDLRRTADLMDGMREDMISVYAEKTKLSRKQIGEMMDAETWLSAKQAKKLGFVDNVVEAKKAKFTACLAAEDLDDYENVPEDVVAEVRQNVPESATMDEDIDIEVEESEDMTPEQIQALVAKGVADAIAALKVEEAKVKDAADAEQARLTAEAAATAQASAAIQFTARVNSACERAISAGKLTNSAESRKFFAALAKDEAALAALDAHYAAAPAIVATALLETPPVNEKSRPQLTAAQRKLMENMGWEESIFDDESK